MVGIEPVSNFTAQGTHKFEMTILCISGSFVQGVPQGMRSIMIRPPAMCQRPRRILRVNLYTGNRLGQEVPSADTKVFQKHRIHAASHVGISVDVQYACPYM